MGWIKIFLLDLIFPRHCLGCQSELNHKTVSLVCEACFDKIVLIPALSCHVCGKRSPKVCRPCRKKTSLKGIICAGYYGDPILKKMIWTFKYQSVESLKIPLADLIAKYLRKENAAGFLFKDAVLTPVPLSRRRKTERGFNQSELLALQISKFLNLPAVNLLKRQKFSVPQADISDWQKRKANISGAFISTSDVHIIDIGCRYKKVILVDDVTTSGATLEECAAVLKKAGIKEIYGITVARG